MESTKIYSSKVLLFGEYTVLHGSKAIAIPYDKYSGRWIYDKNHPSQREIGVLKQYLLKIYREGKLEDFDFDMLEYQIAKGLAFESNIPQGYGVGSSGSVTAAVFDRFCAKKDFYSVIGLMEKLALIESCYHGSSSGIDPLVSYLHQPILMHDKEKVELLDSDNDDINANLYFIDTGVKRRTAPLVTAYLETRRSSELFLMKMQEIAEINDNLIDAYLYNHSGQFDHLMKDLSRAQFDTLKMLIPEQFQNIWKDGLGSGDYSMKLNGAGGGGFLMLYKHRDVTIDAELIKIG